MTPNPLAMGPVESSAEQRSEDVRRAARWLDVTPGVAERGGPPMDVAQAFAVHAMRLLDLVGVDTAELVEALKALVAAKDAAVRAAVATTRR